VLVVFDENNHVISSMWEDQRIHPRINREDKVASLVQVN
jgi:hypothetical protein